LFLFSRDNFSYTVLISIVMIIHCHLVFNYKELTIVLVGNYLKIDMEEPAFLTLERKIIFSRDLKLVKIAKVFMKSIHFINDLLFEFFIRIELTTSNLFDKLHFLSVVKLMRKSLSGPNFRLCSSMRFWALLLFSLFSLLIYISFRFTFIRNKDLSMIVSLWWTWCKLYIL